MRNIFLCTALLSIFGSLVHAETSYQDQQNVESAFANFKYLLIEHPDQLTNNGSGAFCVLVGELKGNVNAVNDVLNKISDKNIRDTLNLDVQLISGNLEKMRTACFEVSNDKIVGSQLLSIQATADLAKDFESNLTK